MRAIALTLVLLMACGRADRERAEVERRHAAEKAEAMRQQAEKARALAEQEAVAAQKKVEELEAKLAAQDDEVKAAIDAVAAAQTDAARKAATAQLEELRKIKADLETNIAPAKAEAAKAQRLKGVAIPKECLDNPLAKGCS